MEKKVVFIDLDGTLIDTWSGQRFPKGVWDIFIKWAAWNALKWFIEQNDTELLCIVTNQGGIENGHVNRNHWLSKFSYIMDSLQEFLRQDSNNKIIVSGEFCPSTDEDDPRRKPNTGMLDDFLKSYVSWVDDDLYSQLKICDNDVWNNKENMIMIGDASGKENQFSDTDKKTAENFGIDYMDIDDLVRDYHKFVNNK